MCNRMRTALKIVGFVVVLYLVVSSIYIFEHIDFEPHSSPEIVGWGYSEKTNIVRVFMGLPTVRTTYEGVPPVYLISVGVRLVLAVALILIIRRKFSN